MFNQYVKAKKTRQNNIESNDCSLERTPLESFVEGNEHSFTKPKSNNTKTSDSPRA